MCILLNGCPQKELANGVVSLPFGSEYSLRFRNKNNRRAVVQIYIDGENVSGAGYIVNANDYVDIKRHHDVDRSFKFVSLDSSDAVDHGKNGPNDDKVKGTIEARFFLEKEKPQVVYRDIHHHHDHYYPRPRPTNRSTGIPTRPRMQWKRYRSGNSFGGDESFGAVTDCYMGGGGGTTSSLTPISSNAQSKSLSFSEPPQLQDGCTVEGNFTGQSFRTVWCDTEDTHTSVKIFLQGYEELPLKKAKKKKDLIDDLEHENERLKREIEELKSRKENKAKLLKEQNDKLKKELEELKSENA